MKFLKINVIIILETAVAKLENNMRRLDDSITRKLILTLKYMTEEKENQFFDKKV